MRSIKSDAEAPAEYVFQMSDPLINFIKKNKEPFLYEEIPADVQKSIKFPFKISLVVPSFYDESSLGFMLLGEKTNRKTYSTDDINVFKILSRQTSMSIENCIFVEEFSKAQEKVFAAEKLASIGGLAEGVTHQINNRLNHFSMLAGELKFEVDGYIENNKSQVDSNPDLKKSFEYFTTISTSLIDNVKRTDGILKGILNYARVEAKETMFSNFAAQDVVNLSLDLLKIKHGLTDFPLEVTKDTTDMIYAIKSQMMEAVYNLLDNAYEATLEKASKMTDEEIIKYDPKISLHVTQANDKSILQFSDNGIGIKDADRYKIFAPFFTTKASSKSGAGIGMYVVRRMVEENHKGKIYFVSEYGKGTKITMELPRKHSTEYL
jgi:signal transduction histidine kinase